MYVFQITELVLSLVKYIFMSNGFALIVVNISMVGPIFV